MHKITFNVKRQRLSASMRR